MQWAYPLLAAGVFFGIVALLVATLAFSVKDILVLFSLTVGLFYGFRIVLIVTGLDTVYPDEQFNPGTVPQDVTTAILWLSLYLVCFGVAAYVVVTRSRGTVAAPFVRRWPDTSRLLLVCLGLTAVSAVVSTVMLAKYGGVGGLITASKIDKTLAGLNFLRIPAQVGAFVCAAGLYDVRIRGARGAVARVVLLVCALLDGFFVFIWGQRSTLVIVAVILVLGLATSSVSRHWAARGLLVAVAVLLVVGVSFGLRVARDTASRGSLQQDVATATLVRKASLATNSTYFDASVLAFRDWPSAYPFRGGQDFLVGLEGAVPRKLWPGKPADVVVGKWFRQVYQPDIVNGWPVGAPTVWYLNFGPLGLVLGGLVSGALVGWLSVAQRRAAPSVFNLVVAVVITVYVLELGLSSETLNKAAFWLLPLGLVAWFVSPRTVSPTRSKPPALDGSPRSVYWQDSHR